MPRLFLTPHPQDEPGYGKARKGAIIKTLWNTSPRHHRKFIKRSGQYLENGVLKDGELYFWGEYEPASDCAIVNTSKPKAIHHNLYPVRGSSPIPPKAQNTDPYVFGNHFKNICCGIGRRIYKPGDVILFGKIEKSSDNTTPNLFSLDTVMVIKERVCVNRLLNITQYYKASIEPLHNKKIYFYRGVSFTLGAQYFSFVPCLLEYSTHSLPQLDLKALGFNVKKNWRSWGAASIPFTHKQWQMILKVVLKSGWMIGTHVDKV